jgi:hypothetical protein
MHVFAVRGLTERNRIAQEQPGALAVVDELRAELRVASVRAGLPSTGSPIPCESRTLTMTTVNPMNEAQTRAEQAKRVLRRAGYLR